MADARQKKVWAQLADLVSATNYAVDQFTQMREPLGVGDIIEVPYISDLTVADHGAGTSDLSLQSVTNNVLSLNANIQPAMAVEIPKMSQAQLLDGSWSNQIAVQALQFIKNSIDANLFAYMIANMAYSSSGAYLVNGNPDALAAGDISTAIARLASNYGAQIGNFKLFVHPYGLGSLQSLAAWQPASVESNKGGNLGIPTVGSVMGVPVVVSQAVPRRRTVASTAFSFSGTTCTVTVASGHGVSPGQYVSFDTVTSSGDLAASSAAAVTSVTATTIVFTNAAGSGSATEAGTITVEACENLLVDCSHMFVAQQRMPELRIVPQQLRTGDVLQASAIYGRVGRSGRAITVQSPPSSAT